ncbi:hypothetical protein D3C80_17720 [compost metagenome]
MLNTLRLAGIHSAKMSPVLRVVTPSWAKVRICRNRPNSHPQRENVACVERMVRTVSEPVYIVPDMPSLGQQEVRYLDWLVPNPQQ